MSSASSIVVLPIGAAALICGGHLDHSIPGVQHLRRDKEVVLETGTLSLGREIWPHLEDQQRSSNRAVYFKQAWRPAIATILYNLQLSTLFPTRT